MPEMALKNALNLYESVFLMCFIFFRCPVYWSYYHRKILDAILNGRIFDACNFMTSHLSLIREYMYENMTNKQDNEKK